MPDPRTGPSDLESPREDLRLVRAADSGDPGAARQLAARLRCIPRILGALNRRQGGYLRHHDLEDLAQDTLATIWEKLETFHGQTTLERWVYRFSYLSMMNRRRKGARIARVEGRRLDSLPTSPGVEDPEPGQDQAFEALLTRLSPVEADVVLLKHQEQCTFEEIGQRMDTSPNTAKTRYYRALRRIEQELRSEPVEDRS